MTKPKHRTSKAMTAEEYAKVAGLATDHAKEALDGLVDSGIAITSGSEVKKYYRLSKKGKQIATLMKIDEAAKRELGPLPSIIDYGYGEIERFWAQCLDCTLAVKPIETVRAAIDLRSVAQLRFFAYKNTFEHYLRNNPELAKAQVEVKDGSVSYETYCKARGADILEWIEKLQTLINHAMHQP